MEWNSVDGILNATSLMLNALFLVKRAASSKLVKNIFGRYFCNKVCCKKAPKLTSGACLICSVKYRQLPSG
jgi:hypothetical protein